MFYALINSGGKNYSCVCDGNGLTADFSTVTGCRGWTVVRFRLTGNTYAERKDAARGVAMQLFALESIADYGLSYGEWADVGAVFEKWARRYGLVEEFRENGII